MFTVNISGEFKILISFYVAFCWGWFSLVLIIPRFL